MGVFFKRSKLRVIESGNFWLSETPEAAASMGWGATLPRMVTWALFELVASGKRFYLYNTHFHHTAQGEEARRNLTGTTSGFNGKNTTGRRIDWILYRGPFTARSRDGHA